MKKKSAINRRRNSTDKHQTKNFLRLNKSRVQQEKKEKTQVIDYKKLFKVDAGILLIESSWNGYEKSVDKPDLKSELPFQMTAVQKKLDDLNIGNEKQIFTNELLLNNAYNTVQVGTEKFNCDLPLQAESVVRRNLPVKFETDEKDFEKEKVVRPLISTVYSRKIA